MDDEPTITFRVDEANHGHVTLSVFIGRNPGARGHSGRLVLRTDEFIDLLDDHVVRRFRGSDPLTLRGLVRFTDDEQVATIRSIINREGQP